MDSWALIVQSLPRLMSGALMTFVISLLALLIGFIGGTILGIFQCKKMRIPIVGYFFDGYVLLIRGTPLYVQLLIMYFAVPQLTGINWSPLMAGVITLGLNSTAYVAEIVRAGINSISIGQWEAATVLGYSSQATFIAIILPQMLRNVLPALASEMINLVKESSILALIGIAELTQVAKEIAGREYAPMTMYGAAAVIYLLFTLVLTVVVYQLEKRMKS